MKNTIYYAFASLVIFCLNDSMLLAQKLPNVQKTSIYAPANVSIDGKPTEWNNQFEAQNNATSLFYTIANDDKNLYITIQAVDAPTINKVTRGGLTLTIGNANKTKGQVILKCMLVKADGRTFFTKNLFDDNEDAHKRINDFNEKLSNNLKDIGLNGVKEIEDTLISVYNEYGIKQAAKLGTKGTLTCEIAIPLKYISSLLHDGSLKYNVMLPGENNRAMTDMINPMPVTSSDGRVTTTRVITSMKINGVDVTNDIQGMYNPTDFSGVYLLAKK